MNIRVIKNRAAFCLLVALGLILAGCFQPVDIGETFVEKGTAHLKLANESEDDSYILEGLELQNAEGETVQSWDGLDLKAGKSCDLHTEASGSFTLFYRVKDTWISETVVDRWEAGPVDIELNKSHDFLFKVGEGFKVTPQDEDRDGLPDIWETENDFDPEDPADGGTVYVSAGGEDTNNGTREQPYKTLAKAAEKARRGLDDAACTVVVLGELNWLNANDRNPENQARADSLFALGKTRHPLTIRGEDPEDSSKPGILQGNSAPGKRVLYIGPGADITLLNIEITGGKQKGGGIYASGATLTLGPGTTITGNQSYDLTAGEAGGIYLERGTLIMEAGSSVTDNTASIHGGVQLRNSRLTMNGGQISWNHAVLGIGGLGVDGCTVDMFDGAEISHNTAGEDGKTIGDTGGGASMTLSEFTMHSGSKITGNKIFSGRGGGLYVTGESKLVMKAGSVVSENVCTSVSPEQLVGWGGGIYLSGTFTMESGALITKNTADKAGGGVFSAISTFTMEGGDITANTAGDNDDDTANTANGGGVHLYGTGSLFKMVSGSIAGNTAETNGGGIYVGSGASFTMTGGTVYGSNGDVNKNEAKAANDPTGHAVYDNRTGADPAAYDATINRFPVPPTP
jgi:hypothetical protein